MMEINLKNLSVLLTRNLDPLVLLIVFVVLPNFVALTFTVHTLVYGIAALAAIIMYGYGGLLSFGHALLLGIGSMVQLLHELLY